MSLALAIILTLLAAVFATTATHPAQPTSTRVVAGLVALVLVLAALQLGGVL